MNVESQETSAVRPYGTFPPDKVGSLLELVYMVCLDKNIDTNNHLTLIELRLNTRQAGKRGRNKESAE